MLDSQLAKQFQTGDLEALGKIVELYQNKVFGLGIKLFKSPDAAADFSQEVFLRAYEKRRHFQPDRPFDPWFFKLAVNLGRQFLRNRREYPTDSEWPELFMEAEAETNLLVAEEQQAVRKALSQVPLVFREALALRFMGDLSMKEIAKTLGVAIGTVKSRLSRGLVAFAREYHQAQEVMSDAMQMERSNVG